MPLVLIGMQNLMELAIDRRSGSWRQSGASLMDKLQYFLESAFGVPAGERIPQEPNEFTKQRQRAFEECAKKIQALREARLAQSARH